MWHLPFITYLVYNCCTGPYACCTTHKYKIIINMYECCTLRITMLKQLVHLSILSQETYNVINRARFVVYFVVSFHSEYCCYVGESWDVLYGTMWDWSNIGWYKGIVIKGECNVVKAVNYGVMG